MGKRAQNRVKKTKTATSSVWDKIGKLKVKDKEESLKAFVDLVEDAQKKKYKFVKGAKRMGTYYIVGEENRNGSFFVHVVPAEAYDVFKDVSKRMPDSFLGFSMLCGKIKKKDLRVSCFGISTGEITKALISKKN